MNTINLLSDAKFFDDSNTKLHELRSMLDSKSINQKLDAMKKLLAMMTLGRDVSAFFPDVVKNVIVDSFEVKKLVYMFLIDYSEQNQDLALLSINTFQKDLMNQNQRTRANALKAMSSIRIPVAGPLVMLALKQSIKDSSNQVKRSAAAAIPKVLSYGDASHDYTEELIELIDTLLQSNEPMVLGSALFAWQSVCPDRFDLLHKHFRKICHLLADFDEWGQTIAVNILTRYGRTQFLSPFDNQSDNQSTTPSLNPSSKPTAAQVKAIKLKPKKAKKKSSAFYSDDDSAVSKSSSDSEHSQSSSHSSDDSDVESLKQSIADPASHMDEDHLLLIRQAQTLLYSANSGVITAVAALHWYLVPHSMCGPVVRPLVRLVRNKRSLQFLLLRNILTMVKAEPKMFEPYLRDFYVNSSDAVYVRALKLEILSYLVTETSANAVLGELGCYVRDHNKTFVCLAIRCLGSCAIRLPTCSEKALQILLRLTHSTHLAPAVIGESVVMIRTLLQANEGEQGPVVKRMIKLLDSIRIPSARASIVWMVGEYRDAISLLAPDVLRKLAGSFKDEHTVVKMQILELAVKLFLSNPKQTSLLFKYIMDLSKYDLDYDLRDRARLLRALFFKKKGTDQANGDDGQPKLIIGTEVKEAMKGLFLMPKPAPSLRDPTIAHDKFTLGSMSHALGVQVPGYVDLPSFPTEQPDPTVRRPVVEEQPNYTRKDRKRADSVSRSRSESGSRSRSRSNSDSRSEDDSDFSNFDSESDNRSDRSESSRSRSRRSESDSATDSEDDRRKRPAKSRGKPERRGRRRSDSDSDSRVSRSRSCSRSRSASRSRSDRNESNSDSDFSRSESSDSEDDRRSRREKEKARERERAEREKQKERERKAAEKEKAKESDKRSKSSEDKPVSKPERDSRSSSKSPTNNQLSDLLDLSDMGSALDAVSSSLGASLSDPLDLSVPPRSHSPSQNASYHSEPVPFLGVNMPSRGARGALLNPIASGGLRMDYAFNRKPSLYGGRMVDIEITCVNESTGPFEKISMREADESLASRSDGFDDMSHSELDIGEQHGTKVHMDFMGKVQPRSFIVEINESSTHTVKLTPPAGELVRPTLITLAEWKRFARKLSGMSEHRLDMPTRHTKLTALAQKILECANLAALGEYGDDEDLARDELVRFAGQRLDNDSRVLVQARIKQPGTVSLLIHAEDFVFATALQSEIKKAIA